MCWLTWEDSPDPTEPFTSLHRTRFLPSWWREVVSARSLSPGDDARQVKPPASAEPGLSGTFLRENYASSPTRTQAQLWTLPQQSCQSWDQRTPSWESPVAPTPWGRPQPICGCIFQPRERVHCFLSMFVLLGVQTTHQLKGQTLTCLNLIFKMVDKECGANTD